MKTKPFLKNALVVLGLCLSAACSKSGPAGLSSYDELFRNGLNPKVEPKIEDQLHRRLQFVKNNPLYVRLVESLNEGRKHLSKQKYTEAYKVFEAILQERKFAAFQEFSFAKYYLAISLKGLGVSYGSLLFFVDLIEKEPLRVHTHDALARALAIAQDLKDDELVLYLSSVISSDKVPGSLQEEFQYYIGKDAYKKKNYPQAVKLLKSIGNKNKMYLSAQYLLGVMAVEVQKLEPALAFFKSVTSHRSPVKYYEKETLLQLSHLAQARIHYERKDFPMAIVNYKKVNRGDEYYPQALDESGWTLFQLKKFNEALSVLHSVHSPFFEQSYFLKSHMLTGGIFLEICHYDQALKALGGVENEFILIDRQIDQFAAQAKDPKEYYPVLTSRSLTPEGDYAYKYKKLLTLVSANRDFFYVHKYVVRLREEQKKLSDLKTPRANIISNLVRQKERELVDRGSWLAGKKLLITKQLVADFMALKDVIRYEIVSTERKILQSRSNRLASPILLNAELYKPEFTESLKESLVWWDYNGEYWKDELGFYLYDMKSVCKDQAEPTAPQPTQPQPKKRS